FGVVGIATAQAQTPEISRGLLWLQGQVQADGSLAGEATSAATALQNRAETAQTLKALAVLPANLADAIAGEPDDNTEYLARRVVSLALAGRDTSTLLTALAARQNADGGFGGGTGYESNPLDTAWALIALRPAGTPASVSQALGYLGMAQAFDGSYSAPGRPDVETTAVAVLAQAIYASQFNSFAAIARAVPYLVHERDISLGGAVATGYIILDPTTGAGAYKVNAGENGAFIVTFLFVCLAFAVLVSAFTAARFLVGLSMIVLGWEFVKTMRIL